MNSRHEHLGTVPAVVHEPSSTGSPLVFDLCSLTRTGAEAVAARVAARHRGYDVALADGADTGRTGRSAQRLTLHARTGSRATLTDDLLADLLAPSEAETIPVSGDQRSLLTAAVEDSNGSGRYVEQLWWDWTGPLDSSQFITAWQSVAERETVLRAGFDLAGAARLVLHDRVAVEVVHHAHAGVALGELLQRERARGFELYRPGLLRVLLLDGPHGDGAAGGPARVVLSWHAALLDERGVRLLVRQFYRSYLAGGILPGGQRRPDLRDHARWRARQDPAGASAFWASAAPPAAAAVRVGRQSGPPLPGGGGRGRIECRLSASQTARLCAWAADRGAGESSVLHVVWALLLYRAAGARGPLPVAFGVHVSGRDMSLRGAADTPGLLGETLPVTVTVEPSAPLADLLLRVRDAALDLPPYAWVCEENIRRWSGRGPDAGLVETTVRFDSKPDLPQDLRAELAAQGIGAGPPHSTGGDTATPLTLAAHHDSEGTLVLTALYDRTRFTATDVRTVLDQCLHLLDGLPKHRDEHPTVGDALHLLAGSPVPGMAPPPLGGTGFRLAVLRAGEPGADVVCLVTAPGVTPGVYDTLLREHEGPQRILSLAMTGLRVPHGPLPELVGEGRRLLLCGSGSAAGPAHDIARRTARRTGKAPTVVMTGTGGADPSAWALSRALEAVLARST
ncbi:condensation domain-containing protein [Streptomyces sp. NPDC004082]|uniref:condensation domain-containing protein n=2 Tax=Streptomyces TaxID=1883 RepID=UPI00339FB255